MKQIENYEVLPVGSAKNLIGQTFGDFKVIYRTKSLTAKTGTFWLCQCQLCGKYVIKNAGHLQKQLNECSCRNDLVGKRFGRWVVQYKTDKTTKNRSTIWHCKCDCGNEKDVDAYTLRSGQSQSCGCYAREIASEIAKKKRIDITGQRYGKLVALYPIYSGEHDKHTKWHCRCDCGNEVDIDMGNLRQGFSKSCGCTQSIQEENIIKFLTNSKINFNYQYRFKDFAIKEYDFYIDNSYIIEYDGQQHFFYTNSGWDTEERFYRTRKSDLEKNKYCFEHNIPLIRIPYDVEYTEDDLKLETTRFLLTPENEMEYYNSRMK